ncbi:uncharacterized protein LOC128895374 [Hylaeus anthracinus]|uniref:uncharacterized protein LOC128895374 n=1 Tax=Hylaeus anthracinus TaxID=313031 RepID=UPI0023B916BA|nr:uncharacterized protein LOC128895374 [Hylaeus anthracinus]
MDVFQREYNTYYSLLCILGLWPYNNSILVKVQRTVFIFIMVCCTVVQVKLLISAEFKLKNVFTALTSGCPIMLFFIRYVGFIFCFPATRLLYGNIVTDCNTLKNSIERDILMQNIAASKRIILIFIIVCCFGIVCVVILLMFPSFLNFLASRNVTRVDYLKFSGFFDVQEKYCIVVAMHATLTSMIGLLVIACTESTLAVYAYYVSGLFRITSYRLRNAVDNAVEQIVHNHNGSNHSSIPEAVAIHTKSIKIIDETAAMITIPYLVAIIVVVVSFGLNLYRLFLATLDIDSIEIIFSGMLVTIHLVIMFLNNYNGQKIIDDSGSVFYETYDTTWYSTPPSVQKLLLMIMHRSSIECAFNLADLFTPSFIGFSTMMSSSFSYFTLLYSTRQNGNDDR